MHPVRYGQYSVPLILQRRGVIFLICLILLVILKSSHDVFGANNVLANARIPSEHYLQDGPFEPMSIPGFVNTGRPGIRSCDGLRFNHTVGVQKSFTLEDNMMEIATALDKHPVVHYPADMLDNPKVQSKDLIGRTWARLAGSIVWLPEQEVYFSVTRVIFTPIGSAMITMSWLRGQLYDRNWVHLDNYSLMWGDKNITFPLVFDIPAPWKEGGFWQGPEDPRVILEEGVNGAEPVVIYNVITPETDWKRAIHIFRPFSNHSTILTIRGQERQSNEKNWSPFFVPERTGQGKQRRPSDYIHFLYGFKPLQILKCHLRCGDCEFVFDQTLPIKTELAPHDSQGSLRGGTNFVPLPVPSHWGKGSDTEIYVSWSRTNIPNFCDKFSFYRPELTIMVKTGAHFYLAFASESLDFGNALVELGPKDDRCGKGRIMIPNSITQWDVENGQDVMTVTFSLDDKTVQVARIHGIMSLVRHLPSVQNLSKKPWLFRGDDIDIRDFALSLSGNEIRGCLVEAALNYTTTAYELTHPPKKAAVQDLGPSKLTSKLLQSGGEI